MYMIKSEKFKNGICEINDGIKILRFDTFMEMFYNNKNIDGVMNDLLHKIFNKFDNINNRYNREYNISKYSDLSEFKPHINIYNNNVLNDLMWEFKFLPREINILNCIKQNGLNNDNCIIVMYNLSGDECIILYDIERDELYNFGCMDKFENVTHNKLIYDLINSLCDDILTECEMF